MNHAGGWARIRCSGSGAPEAESAYQTEATSAFIPERLVVCQLRPQRANQVWSYDFVSGPTHDGRTVRMPIPIDEYTHECLAIPVAAFGPGANPTSDCLVLAETALFVEPGYWPKVQLSMLEKREMILLEFEAHASRVPAGECLPKEATRRRPEMNARFLAKRAALEWHLATMIIVASVATAAESRVPGNQPQAATRPEEPGSQVDPHAQQILRRACTVLAQSDAFTFHAEITFDRVMPLQVKLQFAGASDFAVRRPNALAVDYESDLGAKRLWYNGKTLTIFDAPSMTYASTPVPPSIDGMLDSVAEMHNLTIPLADLALSNPCENLSKRILFGSYVGVGDVAGVACDHLAFAQSNVDWQIWIQRSGKPLPRKIVINYRTTPGLPQYAAVISDWKFPERFPMPALLSRFQRKRCG